MTIDPVMLQSMLDEGYSRQEISESIGVPYSRVYHRSMKSDIVVPKSRKHFKRCKEAYDARKKVIIDRNDIQRMYIDELMTVRDIAEHYGVGKHIIYERMVEYGIQRRAKSDATKLMISRNPQIREKHRKNAANGITGFHSRRDTKTWIENAFFSWAASNGLGVTYGYQLRDGGHRYDYLIQGTNILVELDGVYWHTLERQRLLDNTFCKEADDAGYIVVRFTDTQIKRLGNSVFDKLFDYEAIAHEVARVFSGSTRGT